MKEHFPLKDRLHTDVLEEKYGTVTSKLIRHDDTRTTVDALPIREVHIVDSENISRTYALTFLTYDSSNETIYDIDQQIKNGGLIGKTFRNHGYEIRKNVVDVFTVKLSDSLKEWFKVGDNQAKARLAEFYAHKDGNETLIYGYVLELYSPDFRPADVSDFDKRQINPPSDALLSCGFTTDEIWRSLDPKNRKLEAIDTKRYQAATNYRTIMVPAIKKLISNIT